MFKGYFPCKIINSLSRALPALYLTECLADCKHINAHCYYNENKNTQLPLPLLVRNTEAETGNQETGKT